MRLLFFAAIFNFGSSVNPSQQTLILFDSFTEYISGICKSYCKEKDITLREFVSPYMIKVMASRGSNVPSFMRAPVEGSELDWAGDNGFLGSLNPASTCVLSESDAGISTAERIQSALRVSWNGRCSHVRNKYEMIERLRSSGLNAVKQRMVTSWDDLKDFLEAELWSSGSDNGIACVIKPYTGVASDGVFKCTSLPEAEHAFRKLFQTPQYGGGVNEAVLVQEFVSGTEYAVDTVCRDGHVKVVALWRYHKMSANGAPFVYQCSELVPANGIEAEAVCAYCVRAVEALGIRWGPTHTEIMAVNQKHVLHGITEPTMIEVNGRWHAQHFKPVVDHCLGYDAVTVTMDSVFDPEKFENLPDLPRRLTGAGRILHLISYREGVIKAIHHLDEIAQMPSTRYVSMDYKAGDRLCQTVDIRTDCGYVLLAHEDPRVVQADYEHIVSLQETMFSVEELEGRTPSASPLSRPSRRPSASPTHDSSPSKRVAAGKKSSRQAKDRRDGVRKDTDAAISRNNASDPDPNPSSGHESGNGDVQTATAAFPDSSASLISGSSRSGSSISASSRSASAISESSISGSAISTSSRSASAISTSSRSASSISASSISASSTSASAISASAISPSSISESAISASSISASAVLPSSISGSAVSATEATDASVSPTVTFAQSAGLTDDRDKEENKEHDKEEDKEQGNEQDEQIDEEGDKEQEKDKKEDEAAAAAHGEDPFSGAPSVPLTSAPWGNVESSLPPPSRSVSALRPHRNIAATRNTAAVQRFSALVPPREDGNDVVAIVHAKMNAARLGALVGAILRAMLVAAVLTGLSFAVHLALALFVVPWIGLR